MLISDFKTTLAALDYSTQQLCSHIFSSTDVFIALPGQPFLQEEEAARKAFSFISEFYYREGESDGRFTPLLLGAIALSSEGLSKVAEINDIKEQLQQCVLELKKSLKGRDRRTLSHSGSAKAFRTLMNEIGFGRLSIRQCTRKIPVLEGQVKSIRFSYSTGGKSLAKKTPQEALCLLDQAAHMSSRSQVERELLEKMNPDTQLAQVQRLAGYYKANVVFTNGERKTIPTSLPLVYPSAIGDKPLRQDILPSDQPLPDYSRKRRSDQKVAQHPIISSIRIHAYDK